MRKIETYPTAKREQNTLSKVPSSCDVLFLLHVHFSERSGKTKYQRKAKILGIHNHFAAIDIVRTTATKHNLQMIKFWGCSGSPSNSRSIWAT